MSILYAWKIVLSTDEQDINFVFPCGVQNLVWDKEKQRIIINYYD